jgi:hypothetical protein
VNSQCMKSIMTAILKEISEIKFLFFFFFFFFFRWDETESTSYIGQYIGLIDDDECGAVGGMRIGRETRSNWRTPAPVPLCPPQIPHDLTWDRTRAATVGSRLVTNLSYGAALRVCYQARQRRCNACIKPTDGYISGDLTCLLKGLVTVS